MHFNILQLINNKQELGFDFEQASGKVNAIDMDHERSAGSLPGGRDKAGQLILQNADAAMLPDWAYTLNQDLDWWVSGTGDLINAEGKKLVGANADGSYILEGDANAPVAETAEEAPAEPAVELAENEKLGTAKGMGGDVTVKVTMDGRQDRRRRGRFSERNRGYLRPGA